MNFLKKLKDVSYLKIPLAKYIIEVPSNYGRKFFFTASGLENKTLDFQGSSLYFKRPLITFSFYKTKQF